jgi:hypothetical protein
MVTAIDIPAILLAGLILFAAYFIRDISGPVVAGLSCRSPCFGVWALCGSSRPPRIEQ